MTRRIVVTGGSGFIGTNLVEHLLAQGDSVVNFDRQAPKDDAQRDVWNDVDILDAELLRVSLRDVAPSHVIHLAARTDLRGDSLADYADNTTGTKNVLAALDGVSGVQMFVNASTLLVCANGYTPSSDTDYCPQQPYGESKQIAEEMIRAWDGAPWVIARPTSIWGPWFGEPYRGFFDAVLAGRYVHPGHSNVVKAFGYVGNTAVQLERLLDAKPGTTHYLADSIPYSIEEFSNAVAELAGVRIPRRAPLGALRVAARIGDVIQRVGLMENPPLTSFRLSNMLTSSSYDGSGIDALTGPLPHSMRDGVRLTLDWIETRAR